MAGQHRSQGGPSRRSGYVLVVVLAIAAILALTGTSLLALGLDTYGRALYAAREVAARSAAEAGVAAGLLAMKSYDGIHLPSASDVSLPGCDAGYSYTVVPGASNNTFVVAATGSAGNATKTVHATLTVQSSLFCGIALRQSTLICLGAKVLPEAGSTNPKLLTNSTAWGAVILDAFSVTFQGDVVVGPGGIPGWVVLGSQAVSGTISAASAPTSFATVTPPTGLPYQGNIYGSTTISQDGQYGTLSLTGAGKLVTIQGNRTLYVTGSVSLYNSSRIVVASGSSLTLYVGGAIDFESKASLYEASYDPSKLLILGTGGCTSVNIQTQSKFYGGLYAPVANIQVQTQAEVHGAVAGSTLYSLATQAKLYYDDRVRNLSIPGSSSGYLVSYWQDH